MPDANMFIEPAKGYYSLDIMPAYWTWLKSVMGNDLVTVEPVIREILNGDDDLAAWTKQNKSTAWMESVDDKVTQGVFNDIVNDLNQSIWCQMKGKCKQSGSCQRNGECSLDGRYTRLAVDNFVSGADPWLIAKARVLDATIVTFELRNKTRKGKVAIPNVCKMYDVKYIDLFGLLRRKQVVFDTGKW